ncbi:putative holin-like toxin [Mobilitalea sibirica]|uniref:Putative holin-like toxin n=1 Tax=Mobilitalea sibirica TaxID=1462919 RepID=A0A8J7H8F6_9FIRM|nr:putative holin-like toxin [Mobilitalea sibirica]
MVTVSETLSLLISFGMFIIALLTFVVVVIKLHNKK